MKKCCHPHHEGRENLAGLTERLRGRSKKITGPRQAILDLLRKQEHPLTNKEILAALPRGECDLATVYRSMHLLEEMGIVQRFDFGDGATRFELVADRHEHHHHLVCRSCSTVVEISDCFPADLERKIARQAGFTDISHKLEFFGLCPDCQ